VCHFYHGRAVAQRLDAGFPPRRSGFAYGQHVGFVVDKAALGQVSPSISVSPAIHSTDLSIIIITWGWHNRPLVAAVSNGPWFHPPLCKKKKVCQELFRMPSGHKNLFLFLISHDWSCIVLHQKNVLVLRSVVVAAVAMTITVFWKGIHCSLVDC
jgi:hypothetical protein